MMNLRILAALPCAALIAGSLAAPAAGDPVAKPKHEAQQCFWTRSINGFNAVDDHTVNVRVGVRDIYRLDLLGSCPNVDWSERIGIESRGSSMICSGLDATVIAPSPIGPMRCAVRTVHKLTPEEIAALPGKHRP